MEIIPVRRCKGSFMIPQARLLLQAPNLELPLLYGKMRVVSVTKWNRKVSAWPAERVSFIRMNMNRYHSSID